jgi:hypothetical protein
MIVDDVTKEISSKLEAIGLRAFAWNVGKVTPPGAVVGLPDTIDYDQTYGRGSDKMTIPVWVMVSRASDRAAHSELAAYLDGVGAKSVKVALDSTDTNTYEWCDEVTVTTAEPGAYSSGGVEMLGAEFTVDIAGKGQVS